MKNISFLLVSLILLQSCGVYNMLATVEAAVESEKKVKVFTTDRQKYIFKRLENQDNRLVGITARGSSNSTQVAGMPTSIDGKFLVTDLSNVVIEKIMLRNESASKNLTIVAIAATLLLAAVTYWASDFSFPDPIGSGSN